MTYQKNKSTLIRRCNTMENSIFVQFVYYITITLIIFMTNLLKKIFLYKMD